VAMNAKCWRWLILAGVAGAYPASARAQPLNDPATTRDARQPDSLSNPHNANDSTKNTAETRDLAPVVVTLRETKPTTVVYTEYAGPYWGVGPVLARVRADMASAGRRGPTFVHYPSDPRERTLVPDATRVGYLSEAGVTPNAGYVVEHWGAEQVVTTTVLGPNAGTTALYPLMREWARAHGYAPLGPIVELYYPLAEGAPVKDQQTELRMPVRAIPIPPIATIDGLSADGPTVGAVTSDPGVGRPAAVDFQDSTDRVVTNQFRSSELPTDDLEAVPQGDAKYAPEITPSDNAHATASASFAELIHTAQYDNALMILLPTDRALSSDDADWLTQVNDRFRAVADGLTRIGIPSADVDALATAFGAALRRCLQTHRTAATSNRSGNSIRERQGVIQDLNRLMARISLRSVDGPTCISELRELMIRLDAVMNPEWFEN